MNHDKIFTWLGLPAGNWPPDHYSLLGLHPGESDVTRIEQHAHERLAKLRCYQLSHPDQVTEAMNRLAQAFMCLTDPEAKKAYDRTSWAKPLEPGAIASHPQPFSPGGRGEIGQPFSPEGKGEIIQPHSPGERGEIGPATPVQPAAVLTEALDDTAVVRPQTQVDWKSTPPPPVRLPVENETQAPSSPAAKDTTAAPETPIPQEIPAPGAPASDISNPPSAISVSQPADEVYNAAHASFEARRGLGTLRAIVERIDHTRKLLWAWEQAGKYLNRPRRRLTRTAQQNELFRRLAEIGNLLEGFPHILGQPGQPGYRVVALARLEMTTDLFNMLDATQRQALASDWLAGKVLLMTHRRFLLRRLQFLRRQNPINRAIHAGRALLNDHPGWVFLALGAAALASGLVYFLLD